VSLGFVLFDEMEGVENFPKIPLSGRNVSKLRPSRRNVSEGSHRESICEAKTVRMGTMEREMRCERSEYGNEIDMFFT
jgi:hypothetical protein